MTLEESVITVDQEIPHAHTPHQTTFKVTKAERESVEQRCLHAYQAKVVKSYNSYWDYSQARHIYTVTWTESDDAKD